MAAACPKKIRKRCSTELIGNHKHHHEKDTLNGLPGYGPNPGPLALVNIKSAAKWMLRKFSSDID